MIQTFANKLADHLFHGITSKETRRFPAELKASAARKLTQLDAVTMLETLRVPPGNRLEALSHDRAGQHSIRINDQWRICFRWTENGPADVEVVDYH
jgi:proteic killer suppression protein